MIRILTDSASDILPAEAEQLGVTVIPLNVTLEDGSILRVMWSFCWAAAPAGTASAAQPVLPRATT